MAYFPNGCSGEVLVNQCAECLPYDACPVAWVQLEYNYDQCNNEKFKAAMNCLVNEKGICQMKKYVKPRLTQGYEQKAQALSRKLVFGDREQIEALNDPNFEG